MANLNLTQEKLEALRSEYKYRNVRGKYPRQRMLPEYMAIYPWVLPDEVDPYFAFCTICECRLSAKRSDLGKHEGSIKHTENAAKKGVDGAVVLKGCHPGVSGQAAQELQQSGLDSTASTSASASQDEDEDGDEVVPVQCVGDDDDGLYIKQEPVIDLVETSNAELNLGQLSPNSDDDEEEEEEEDDDDDYEHENSSYVPPVKRRASDTLDSQSQHSSTLDYLPVQVTLGEASSLQRFSIREIPPTPVATYSKPTACQSGSVAQVHYASPLNSIPPAQTPCKITIKKITAPLPTPAASAQVPVSAALAAVPASITISQQPKPAAATLLTPHSTAAPSQSTQTAHSTATVAAVTMPAMTHTAAPPVPHVPIPVRDSYDLFFDSICASVKALPPKLATEGKIRVMQLIGELEMRAIAEREESSAGNVNAAGQQSATVASTTK